MTIKILIDSGPTSELKRIKNEVARIKHNAARRNRAIEERQLSNELGLCALADLVFSIFDRMIKNEAQIRAIAESETKALAAPR